MEVLDQGKQDDSSNKIYSFFIKHFPELRPEKTKDGYYPTYKVLKLSSEKGYDLIILVADRNIDRYSKIRVAIRDRVLGKTKQLDEFEMSGNLENFVKRLKEKLATIEGEYKDQGKKEISPILQSISERFNIKLKKDERGDWEIRQKYQDADKKYVITFYIREGNGQIYFVLQKQSMKKTWSSYGYNINHVFEYNNEQTAEEIVNIGLNGLKESANQEYKESARYDAMKTIEFLRKKVFKL
jgi:hypothetical protein